MSLKHLSVCPFNSGIDFEFLIQFWIVYTALVLKQFFCLLLNRKSKTEESPTGNTWTKTCMSSSLWKTLRTVLRSNSREPSRRSRNCLSLRWVICPLDLLTLCVFIEKRFKKMCRVAKSHWFASTNKTRGNAAWTLINVFTLRRTRLIERAALSRSSVSPLVALHPQTGICEQGAETEELLSSLRIKV